MDRKQTNKFFSILFFSITILSCTLLVSCGKQEQRVGAILKPVHVAKVVLGDVPIYIDAIGILSSPSDVNIRAQVTGKIDKCYFAEGQYVKKGDLLFTIDSQLYRALLDQSKATLAQDIAIRNLAKFIVDKNKKLPAAGAMAVQDYAKNLAALDQAEGTVELDKALIQQNEIKLGYCKILSPIDGITGYRQIDPGNIVKENDGPVLVNIKATDDINVDFTIPEKNMELLKTAMKSGALQIIITVDNLNVMDNTVSKKYYGTLQVLDNAVNTATGTISLRGVVPNHNRELWPGQFVKVRLVYLYSKNSLLVPYLSVTPGLKGECVFFVKNGKAYVCWVETGLRHGDYTVVSKFIGEEKFSVGDDVVTIGQMGLVNGDGINILEKDSFSISVEEKSNSTIKTK